MATIDFDDEDAVLADVAQALDIDPDDLKIRESHLGDFGAGTVYEVTVRGGRAGKEWNVVADEDQEIELATAIVKQDLEEQPEIFERNFIESHINTDRLRRDLESDTLNSRIDDLHDLADRRPDDFWEEYEREGFDAPEEDEDGERPEPDDSQIEELADPHLFLLRGIAGPAEQSGIEFLGQQRVLEAFHGPVENRNDHLLVQTTPQFPALQPKAHESHCAIGVLRQQETVDLAL